MKMREHGGPNRRNDTLICPTRLGKKLISSCPASTTKVHTAQTLLLGTAERLVGSSVVAITGTPSHTLATKVFVRDPAKLSWADGFAISQGYLYIADSHLWEIAFKNNLPRSGPFTIFRAKLPEGRRGRSR